MKNLKKWMSYIGQHFQCMWGEICAMIIYSPTAHEMKWMKHHFVREAMLSLFLIHTEIKTAEVNLKFKDFLFFFKHIFYSFFVFSFSSYYSAEEFAIMKIFDFQFLLDLLILGCKQLQNYNNQSSVHL